MPDETSLSWRRWRDRWRRRWRTWRTLPLLYLLLWRDPRVSGWARLFPILGWLYLFLPFDGDWVLVPFGWLDDLFVLWFSLYLFRRYCPREVVEEHLRTLRDIEIATAPQPTETETKET